MWESRMGYAQHVRQLPLAVSTRVRNRIRQPERGYLMADYGLLIFMVAIAAVGILVLFGGEVWELFRESEEGFDESRKIPPDPD